MVPQLYKNIKEVSNMGLLKRFKNIIMLLVVAALFISTMQGSTAFAGEIVKGTYNINISDLNITGNAIQSLAFVENSQKLIGSEVYLTVRSTSTTYVVRCSVSGMNITGQDYIELKEFGHGESLEIIKENGKTYLWLGSSAYAGDTSKYWSTKISCVEYIPNGTTKAGFNIVSTYAVDQNGKITLDSANGYKINTGTPTYWRVSIAFSTASICVRIANSDESKYIYFNNIDGGLTNAKIDSTLRTSTPYISKVDKKTDRVSSNGVWSYQSHDIYNGFIYVAGGGEDGVAKINKLKASTGALDTTLPTIDISNVYGGKQLEMEGIKVNQSYIFYMLKPYGTTDLHKNTKIYYIDLK